jgi:RIO kinase 1
MFEYWRYLEEDEDDVYKKPRKRPKINRTRTLTEIAEQPDEAREEFNPTFHASRHERAWILSYLGGFYEDQVITDVLRQVKGGKEATVYCCAAHPVTGAKLIAAKVYRPSIFRNLKNDSLYREGRDVLDESGKAAHSRREKLAMAKKTRFGQDLSHLAWLSNEFRTMSVLHEAGADVPKPFAQSENAILMDYIGEERWPAPTLIGVNLRKTEAQPLFDRVIENINLMLTNEIIHADLSAHNILYWDGEVKIIDFPQAVNPYVNPQALALLERDVERVCQYFARYGVEADARQLAADIWARHIPT